MVYKLHNDCFVRFIKIGELIHVIQQSVTDDSEEKIVSQAFFLNIAEIDDDYIKESKLEPSSQAELFAFFDRHKHKFYKQPIKEN